MNMTRILALALALMLALSGAAFAEGNFNETGLPIVNDKIEMTVAVNRHPNDTSATYNDKHFAIDAEEQTNIHINWIEVSSDASERLAVMLAGDMPDAFVGLLNDSLMVQNSSMFLVLDDLIETYAPNVLAYYEAEIDGWREYLTYPDGHIYSLMGDYAYSYNNSVNGLPFINKTWLEKVGKEVPTTLDELHDVLVAFRDNDMDGDGDATNEIPFDFCEAHYAGHLTNLATYFGLALNNETWYDIIDGKVTPLVTTDEYRNYLETMYQWGQEGLINLEGLTMANDQYTSDLDSMKVGMFYGWAPYTYITAFDNQQQYVAMAPVSANGVTPRVCRGNPMRANRNNFVIAANSKYQKEALRWWDFLSHDQDYAMFVNRGEDGLIYKKGDDGVYYAHTPTVEDLKKFGYDESMAGLIGTSSFAATPGTVNNHPLVKNAISPDIENDPTNSTAVRAIAMNLTSPYFVEQYQSKAIVPADIQEELDFAIDGMATYIKSFAAEAVQQGVTDASWEAYLSELSNYGYDYYIEWNQKYFDGTLGE